MCLVFTGVQRLAKDTLINALRESSLSQSGVCRHSNSSTVLSKLSLEAEAAFVALQASSGSEDADEINTAIDVLSETLNSYWSLKKKIAPGSEPQYIRQMRIYLAPLCSGISLCGAGAGGFMILILKRGVEMGKFDARLLGLSPSLQISKHSICIDTDGIVVEKKMHSSSLPLLGFLGGD